MDFNLDRKLRLLTDPEHKGLYSWAINEVDDQGQVVGNDQVPWVWNLFFTATELVLGDELTVREGGEIEGRLPQKSEIAHRRTIRAKLRPGDTRRNSDWFRETTFKMFGTDRTIKDFQIDILPLDSEDEAENCSAWGSVSYIAETDFRHRTAEDCIIFYLMLKPSTFERYAQRIASGTADEVILGVGMVSGFYSEWSPSISTDDVKVLTHGGEQNIELPVGISFEAPRLGSVGEAQLYINAKRIQAKKLQGANEGADQDQAETSLLVRPEAADIRSAGIDRQAMKLLESLKTSALWIIGLLLVLVIATLMRR